MLDSRVAEIDKEGVGKLMKICITLIKVGNCDKHGGNPESIELCYKLRLDYVSCSPYRVLGVTAV